MTSGEVPQKFLTEEASCHHIDLGNAYDWMKQISLAARPNQEHYPDQGSNTSSAGNFCSRFSDLGPVVYMTPRRLSHRSEFTPVPSNGSTFVYMIPP